MNTLKSNFRLLAFIVAVLFAVCQFQSCSESNDQNTTTSGTDTSDTKPVDATIKK